MKTYSGHVSSSDKWFGRSAVFVEGERFLTRYWIGRLRLHIFYQGDPDRDHHDHPWDFWTFPLRSYVEEVVRPYRTRTIHLAEDGTRTETPYVVDPHQDLAPFRQIVWSWQWTFRPAEHCHRVLGAWNGCGEQKHPYFFPDHETKPGRVVTIVWRAEKKRDWGFLKNRNGVWCWTPWKVYVFGGGKHAACE